MALPYQFYTETVQHMLTGHRYYPELLQLGLSLNDEFNHDGLLKLWMTNVISDTEVATYDLNKTPAL